MPLKLTSNYFKIMTHKKLSTLKLKKESVNSLSHNEQLNVKGGWTTTIGACTKFPCCAHWTLVRGCAQEHIKLEPIKELEYREALIQFKAEEL